MNYSLRQLLLFTLLPTSMLIWGATAYVNYRAARNQVATLFDAELAQSARVLLSFLEEGLPQDISLAEGLRLIRTGTKEQGNDRKIAFQLQSENAGLLHSAKTNKYEEKIAFQVWSKEKGLLYSSKSAPKFPTISSSDAPVRAIIDGHLWHVFSIASGDNVIHVAQKDEIRAELTDQISSQLVIQSVAGLPLLGIVIWFIVGYTLRPLNRLERALSKREASFLKPLTTRKMPLEIVPVVNEINNLFVQLEQAFEHERRFTADASHELRTPLAGLLTQAQVALRTTDEAVRKQALLRISQAVHRMTYMVQQLLTFSRIESGKEYLVREITIMNREVIQVITELEPAAHKKRIQMEFEEHNAVPILANTQLITILVRNIIDNAIKYTPANGSIMIHLEGKEKQLQFCVEDSGPGIPPDQYEKSLKRFHRCAETSHTAQGSGLGFSIVERIASMYAAELTLGVSQFGGLKVTVNFHAPKNQLQNTPQQLPPPKKMAKV